MKHRVKIIDLGMITVILSIAAVIAFDVWIFEHEAELTQAAETELLNRLMGFSAFVLAGGLFYALRRALEHQRENERRLAAEREVMNLALQDPLTGLPNRRQFDEALKGALKTVPSAPEAHAIFMIDLNGFKKINDVHGHPVGDQVLIHVAARLLRAVREGDLVARLGGDEFTVIARNVSGAEGAAAVARRIVECLASPVTIGGGGHPVGAGIGVALAPHDGVDADELLRKADVALYRAKEERNSAIRFFEPEMDARLLERDALERDLRAAIETGAVELGFLPTKGLGSDRINGFEAKPRWPHPTLGELGPDRFLPIAEETGLLPALTERLLRRACAGAALWPAHVRLSFNLPGALLFDSAFGLRILAALAASGLSPSRFDLEIDEGALIRAPEAAERLITELRRAGVSIVADNFGTGYSDLKNLQKLQLDRVKIDRSFVSEMDRSKQAAAMVKALISIGQVLDLAVIADGVVSDDQRRELASQGCDQAQGALYGEAVSAEAAAALVGGADRASPSRA